MTSDILSQLKTIEELDQVPDDELLWFIENSTCKTYKEGDYLFRKGEPIDQLIIILEGRFVLKVQQHNQFRVIGTFEKNTVTGLLPYSRAKDATGFAEATSESHVLSLERSFFREMIHDLESLTTAFVHIMSSRIRQFTKLQQQNDKMMALGKLSAGLAHELNNPSAAVVRSAHTLQKHLGLLPTNFKSVIKIKATDEQIDCVNHVLFEKVKGGIQELALMQKTALEDTAAQWLEERGVEDGYELAENFVDFGFTQADFETIANCLRPEDLLPVISWLNQVLTTEKLVCEIQDASQRINDLVTSVKGYTHMDQAPEKRATDIHIGIKNTITMLNHKIKKSNVTVEKHFNPDLPQPEIFVSEMNQVWTNLIDNAIDAMKNAANKVLTIETLKDGTFVYVIIGDTGSGIPEEIQDQIFDPFFTTKAVGEGTGLGLDVVQQIVRQHNGSIKLYSKPGETKFKVCIPIK